MRWYPYKVAKEDTIETIIGEGGLVYIPDPENFISDRVSLEFCEVPIQVFTHLAVTTSGAADELRLESLTFDNIAIREFNGNGHSFFLYASGSGDDRKYYYIVVGSK